MLQNQSWKKNKKLTICIFVMFCLVCFRFDMINNLYPSVFLPCFVLFEGRRFFVLFEFWHLMFYLSFDMIISRWSYFCLCSLTVENWELAKKGGRNPTTGDVIIIPAIFIMVKRNPTTGDITIFIMVRSNNDESANILTIRLTIAIIVITIIIFFSCWPTSPGCF